MDSRARRKCSRRCDNSEFRLSCAIKSKRLTAQNMNTQTQPRVSILTPVYNGAEHLAECIESVLRQTHTNWDYTIVTTTNRSRLLKNMQPMTREFTSSTMSDFSGLLKP